MSNINYGGPAFPVSTRQADEDDPVFFGHQDGHSTWQFGGMTLRDYFAAKAMQVSLRTAKGGSAEEAIEKAAKTAYLVADAMLRAREAKS